MPGRVILTGRTGRTSPPLLLLLLRVACTCTCCLPATPLLLLLCRVACTCTAFLCCLPATAATPLLLLLLCWVVRCWTCLCTCCCPPAVSTRIKGLIGRCGSVVSDHRKCRGNVGVGGWGGEKNRTKRASQSRDPDQKATVKLMVSWLPPFSMSRFLHERHERQEMGQRGSGTAATIVSCGFQHTPGQVNFALQHPANKTAGLFLSRLHSPLSDQYISRFSTLLGCRSGPRWQQRPTSSSSSQMMVTASLSSSRKTG